MATKRVIYFRYVLYMLNTTSPIENVVKCWELLIGDGKIVSGPARSGQEAAGEGRRASGQQQHLRDSGRSLALAETVSGTVLDRVSVSPLCCYTETGHIAHQ